MYETAQKSLQTVEACIKINRAWTLKSSVQKGVTDFNAAWKSLQTFLSASPSAKLQSNYMWGLVCSVKGCQQNKLMPELKLSVLKSRLTGEVLITPTTAAVVLHGGLSDCSRRPGQRSDL